MKKIITLILLLFIYSSNFYSQTGWFQQNSGTLLNLNSVYFVDGNTGYTVGDTGQYTIVNNLFKTTNGGSNWVRLNFSFYPLSSVFFLDANTGFICGGGTYGGHTLSRTTNGGLNWNGGLINDTTKMYSVYFINSLTGFQTGFYGLNASGVSCIFKSTDGGITWNKQYIGLYPEDIFSISFGDINTGYICGAGIFGKTTNTGVNWMSGYLPPISNMRSVFFINNTIGWIVGDSYNVNKTTNGGTNWSSFNLGNYLYSIRFVNDQSGWVCGNGGAIYGTTNGGTNWTQQTTGISTTLYSLYFINAQTGWAVGATGRILKTTTGGLTLINPISNEVPNNFKLFQNYPNPFNPITKIKYQIAGGVFVKLIIYDILGREIGTLVNENLQPGSYEARWDATNYSSGVYFYRIQAGNYVNVKKIVLVK